MKAKKLTILSVLCASLALGIGAMTGCGSVSNGGKMPRPGDGVNGTLNIEFWNTFSHKQLTRFQILCQNFHDLILEQDGIDVQIINQKHSGYQEMADAITKAFNKGQTPNLAVAYPDHVAGYINSEEKPGDYIVNLDPYINNPEYGIDAEEKICSWDLDDFLPTYLDEGRHYARPGTLSLPFEKSTEIMFYNTTAVKKVMVDLNLGDAAHFKQVPKDEDDPTREDIIAENNAIIKKYMDKITWGEFMTMINYINDNRDDFHFKNEKNKPKYVLFYDSDANLFITQSYQRGLDYISIDQETGKGSIDFNNPESRAMVAELQQMHNDGLLCTRGTESDKYSNIYLKNEQCFFSVGSSGGAEHSAPEDASVADYGICKFPVYQELKGDTYVDIPVERQKYVSQGITLTMFSNPALKKAWPEVNDLKMLYSWKFLKYITNNVNQVDMCLASSGYVPSRDSARLDPNFQKLLKSDDFLSKSLDVVINDIGDNYYNYPVFPGSKVCREQVGNIIKVALSQNENIKYLFDEAHNNVLLAM